MISINEQQFPNVDTDVLHGEITQNWQEKNIAAHIEAGKNQKIRFHDENSMAELNEMQRNELNTFTNRYRESIDVFGADEILNGFKTYLEERYAKQPAIVNGVALPLNPQSYGLSHDKLKAYYQHPIHCALRYLSSPNPLIHPYANYITNSGATITTQQKSIIASFWYALNNDEKFVLPNGISSEDGINWFINMLSSMNRQHNWDNTRRNPNTGKMENYDDLEGDRPTCTYGVNQNLVQFLTQALVDDPNIKTLNVDVMLELFKDHFITENSDGTSFYSKIDNLNLETLRQLKAAITSLIIDCFGEFDDLETENEKELLRQFSWSTNDIVNFLDKCKRIYGVERFKTQLKPEVNWGTHKYDNYGYLTLEIMKQSFSLYHESIFHKIDTRITDLQKLQEKTAKKQDVISKVASLKKESEKVSVKKENTKQKKEASVKIARRYPLARSSGYLNNCAMHSVIHNWLSLPEEQIRDLADRYPIYDILFQELFNYYQLPGEYNRETIFALNRQFNHPRDREILWGQVFRITLRNLLVQENRFNDAFSISDLQFISDDFVALLTQRMGANLEVHNRAQVAGALPIARYNIENPQWQLSLHHLGNHYDFSFNHDELNDRHNASYAHRSSAKLYRASVTGGDDAFLTPGVPEIQKQAIQQIVTQAFLNPNEQIAIPEVEIQEEKVKAPSKKLTVPFLPSYNGEQPTLSEIRQSMKSDAVRAAFDGRSDRAKNTIAGIFAQKMRFDHFKNQTEDQQLRAVSRAPRTREQILSAMKSDAVRAAFNGRSKVSQDQIVNILSKDTDYVAFAAKTEAEQLRAVSRRAGNRIKAS